MSNKIDYIAETSVKVKTTVTDSYDYQMKRVKNIKLEAQARSKQLRDFMTTCFVFINSPNYLIYEIMAKNFFSSPIIFRQIFL